MKFNSPTYQRRLQPLKYYFKEIVPLCSKNGLEIRRQTVSGSACVEELQTLFACLKKWEFDDLPCEALHVNYNRCVEENAKIEKKLKEVHKDAPIGTGEDKSLTAGQFDKLIKLYPQPDLGQKPYRLLKRLPNQSYADDLFNRKNWKGKPS